MLQRDLKSPFIPEPKAPGDKDREKEKEKEPGKEENAAEKPAENAEEAAQEQDEANKDESDNRPAPIKIDLDGITQRVVPFPVSEGLYTTVLGIKGKALFLSFPIEGTIDQPMPSGQHEPKGRIESIEFETQKQEFLMDGVGSFKLSRDAKTLLYRANSRLRILKAGDKAPRGENTDRPNRDNGWIDLNRVKVSVQPAAEWKQMFAEAWRLQREQFWTEDMSGVEWDKIYAQYAPLVERVSSRAELSDLFWELQGELGTSHAYYSGVNTGRDLITSRATWALTGATTKNSSAIASRTS
jgi:tricorn protease